MRHILWQDSPTYPIALLIKSSAFNKIQIENNYTAQLDKSGVQAKDVIAFTLSYDENGKASAKYIKEYLSKLLPALDGLGTKLLYVADSTYFKVLAGKPRAEPNLGYVLPCRIKGFEHMNVVLGVNHTALIYNPELQAKLDLSLHTLSSSFHGTYQPLGQDVIHSASYPEGQDAIRKALNDLHRYPSLTCDIEGFSLRFDEAGVGTISFAWDCHNGLAFACDYKETVTALAKKDEDVLPGTYRPNPEVRALIKRFLTDYQGELTFHNAAYDAKVLIYHLWMKDGLDNEGLLEGLEVLTRHIHDTKIIAYLATNTTAGNVLGLKPLAHEFAGNWAVEVKDIRAVPLPKLLEYNLIDALCTHYVRDKYFPIMVADQQLDIYENLMLPSLKLILQMELTGMPLLPERVMEARIKLETIREEHLDVIINSPMIQALNLQLQTEAMVAANLKLKIKQHPIEKFAEVVFNPNSGPQLQKLLYGIMNLPVIDLTDTKMPATGADTLEKLINHCTDPAHKAVLTALIGYGQANKIVTTFIPAFELALDKGDGVMWLHGSFNLGGTVSGRLSSSEPNLQNLPANSIYAKLVKECFCGPDGWLFAGADFNSLEDYISALTTKDPNKLKVYEQGFDGHCLRAVAYFREDNADLAKIDINDPKQVNVFKAKDHPLEPYRQASKVPTFALTYAGTYHTLMANLGFTEEKAKAIEAGYHELYQVSDQYVAARLAQASKDGYATVAFGLRVRTPLLSQVIWGSGRVPFEAQAEGRTVGNALGQSYGLLNNRAAVDFFRKVWASKYRHDIKPVALIHDAIYILIRDSIEVVEWANRELIKSMQWQDLPEIQHPTVKLGAALDIFWPSWARATTLPNDASQEAIRNACKATKEELLAVV